MPSIQNRFRAADGDVDKTVSQIIEFAEADGWTRDDSLYAGIGWIGRKNIYNNELTVIVKVRSEIVIVEIL